jgi:hypothetical protein
MKINGGRRKWRRKKEIEEEEGVGALKSEA